MHQKRIAQQFKKTLLKLLIMKKSLPIVTFIICILMNINSFAQINTFPASEGFEAVFDTGLNIVFVPNWIGNEVRSTPARIFADNANFHAGVQALGMIPTSSFIPQVIASLNLTGISNMTANFWAKSEANGTGTRPAVVFISASVDGGVTYSPAVQIGDSIVFANASTAWAQYYYPFPSYTNNQSDVRLKIELSRGAGTGTTARFITDDFSFIASSVDSFPPTALSAKATLINSVEVQFSEHVDASAEVIANYTGLPTIMSAVRNGSQDKVTLTLSTPLTLGQVYTLNIANVNDQNGNMMTTSQNFDLAFNDNTGNVKFTEIMYNNPGNDSLEFVEIKNLDGTAINIGGWKFTSGLNTIIPSGTVIGANAYLVFAKYPIVVDAFFGITSIGWNPTSSLSNSGEKIAISNSLDVLIDSVTYGIAAPWDTLANGYGYSLTLCSETADNDIAQNWSHSLDSVASFNGATIYATPGSGCLTVGVEENSNANQNNVVLIQPNPSSDNCAIRFSATSSQALKISLTDINGRELVQENFNATAGTNHYVLNTTPFENGIYILRTGNQVAKLVVQH